MRKRVQNNRVLAGFLAAVTAFSPVMSSIPVYAADVGSDGISVDTGSEDSGSVSVSDHSNIVLSSESEDGSSAIVIEDDAKEQHMLSLNLADVHGEVVIRDKSENGMDEQHIRLSESDGKKVITVRDANGEVLSETAYEDASGSVLTIHRAAGTVLSIEVIADEGYDVSKYAVTIDNGKEDVSDQAISVEGEPVTEDTNFVPDTYVSFAYDVTLDADKTISASFEDLNNIQISDVGSAKEKPAIDVEKGSGIVVAESDQVKRQDIKVEDTEAKKDADKKEMSDSEAFASSDASVKKYDEKDFTSGRLLALSEDPDLFIDPEHIIGVYDNLYLLQYDTPEQARNAYAYYLDVLEAVEPDASIDAATGSIQASNAEDPMTEEDNPVTVVSEAEPVHVDGEVIALVDSGVADSVAVSERVSVLDERLVSDHMHGTEMAQAIYGVNPDASILSIRALDDQGDGTVSAIAAAIKYAIVHRVDVINLSLCAKKTLSTAVLEKVIQEALQEDISVVGAAGNYGKDAKDYVPGVIQDAYIVGACDEKGNRIRSSNYGSTVDFNVVAGSTSEAAAKFSGYLSLHENVQSKDLNQGLIYQTDYNPADKDASDNIGVSPVLNSGDVIAVLGSDPKFEESKELSAFHFDILESYVSSFVAGDGLDFEASDDQSYDVTVGKNDKGTKAFAIPATADSLFGDRYTMLRLSDQDAVAKAIYRFQVQDDWSGVASGKSEEAFSALLAKLSYVNDWDREIKDANVKKAVSEMEAIVAAMSSVTESGMVSVSPSYLKAQMADGVQKTGSYRVFGGSVSFTVPNGVTLVNVSNGNSRHTKKVTLSNGTEFYFEAPLDQAKKYDATQIVNVESEEDGYLFYRIFTAKDLQDLVGYRKTDRRSFSFKVEWTDGTGVAVEQEPVRKDDLDVGISDGLLLYNIDPETGEKDIWGKMPEGTVSFPQSFDLYNNGLFVPQKAEDTSGTSTNFTVGSSMQSTQLVPSSSKEYEMAIMNPTTLEIDHFFNEGLLGFTDGSKTYWGFCGDVKAHYRNSVKTAQNAVAIWGEDKCKQVCAAISAVNEKYTGHFGSREFYGAWQTVIWTILNENAYPGCIYILNKQGNCSQGHPILNEMVDVALNCKAWGNAGKSKVTLKSCLYWTDGDASSQPLTTWAWEYGDTPTPPDPTEPEEPDEPEEGYIRITKKRATGSAMCDTNYRLGGEAIYSREGARYSIKGMDGTSYGTLTTNSSGETPTSAALPVGTYRVTEIEAPHNYILGDAASREKTVTVTKDNTASVTFYNQIEGDPIDLAMFKHQNGTRGNKLEDAWIGPQGDSNWADARFRLYYFNTETKLTLAQMQSRVDAGSYVEAWNFKMNDVKVGPFHIGMTSFTRSNYLGNVKGVTDPAFVAGNHAQFPIGTYLLVETAAPRGFELPDIRFGFQIYQINGNATLSQNSNATRFLAASFPSEFQPGDDIATTFIPPSSVDENSSVIMIAEAHDRYGLKIQKGDINDRSLVAQGDGNWSGIRYSITNVSENPVVIDGQTFRPGEVISNVSLVTDASGYAQTTAVFPQGTYEVREVSRTDDLAYYQTDQRVFRYTLHDSDDGTKLRNGQVLWPDNYLASNGAIADHVLNEVIGGGLQFSKIDFMLNSNNPHGDTDLSGAQYAVINASDAYVLNNQVKSEKHNTAKRYLCDRAGVEFVPKSMENVENAFGNASTMYRALKELVDRKDGSVVYTGTTNTKGQFSLPQAYLPYGTYYIIEIKTPTGYLMNSDWVGKVVVRDSNKNTIIPVTSVYNSGMNVTKGKHEQPEQIYRGGVTCVKFDLMRDDTRDHGDATLEGAEFTIINASEHPSMNKDRQVIPTSGLNDSTVSYEKLRSAAATCTMQVIRTNRNGIAKTGDLDLPYGTYYVYESRVPAGYFLNEKWYGKVVIRENGKMYNVETKNDKAHDEYNHDYYQSIGHTPVITPGDDYAVRDQIFRSGVNIQKIDKEMGKQTPQGESVLYGAEFKILNASDASIRNRDRLDIETCKAQAGSHPDYATLRRIADEGSCTVETLTTNSEGYVTGKTTDLPYGTYYVIETKASYGYHIDTTFIGKIVIRDDGLMLSLGERVKNSSFIDINDPGIQVVEEQQRRANLYMLKVNIDGEYKPYIPFLISAVRVEPDGSETVLESHVMVTDENGRLDTRRVPRDPSTINGMDRYVKEKTITPEGEQYLKEAAKWGVWFQGNSDDSPKTAVNDTFGALYTGHYRITELHCRDNADLEENLVASDLIYVYNDRCEQDQVMTDHNDDLVVHHPLVDTEIQIRSEAKDTESETKTVPVRESVEVQDYVEFNHVSADHRYRMETKFIDLTNGYKPIKIQGTTDDKAELSEDHLWVTKEFMPKQQSGTNNTYDNLTMYATLNTKELMGHKIMAVNYLYQYIDVTSMDDVNGDWILVARHPGNSEVVEEECLYIPDLHTNASDGETDTRVGVKSKTATIYDTVEYQNLSRNEQYVIRMTVKDTETGEYAVTDADGNPIYVVSKPIFRRTNTPVNGQVTMPKLTLDSSKFSDEKSLTVVEELFRSDEEGNPMGEPILVHDSMLDENQTIRYIDMDSLAWDVKTRDDVGTVESEATITDKIVLNNVIFENREDGQYTYEVDGRLVHQKPYTDKNGRVFQAGDDAELLDGSQNVVTITADANGVAEIRYADGTLANGKVTVKDYGKGVCHLVHPERVGENQYVTNANQAIADVEVEMIYKVDSSLLEDATLVSYATLHHDASMMSFAGDASKSLLERFAELFAGEKKAVAVTRHEDRLDEDQTVHYPRVQTSAIDNSTKDDVGAIRDDAVVKDTVTLRNLIPGHEYIVKGVLMNQQTGEPYVSNGDAVTQKAHVVVTEDGEITAPNGERVETIDYNKELNEVDGTVDLIFRFNAVGLEDITLVVFEDLVHNGVTVATHTDIEDKGQSIHFPKIRTTNNDGYTKDHVATWNDKAVIVDTVKYSNLVPGKTYTMNGTLMNKDTGEKLLDKNLNPVHASRTFVAGQEGDGLTVTNLDEKLNRVSGTVDITFEFDATLLEGTTAVAFEELVHNKITVTTHADMQDEEQTVHFPKVRTSAIDINTKDEVGVVGETTITDTVRLWNLIPGQTYTVNGVLMDKDTKKPLLVDGEEVHQSATVRILENGTVDTSVSKECTCGNPKYCTCGNGSVRITSWNSDMRSVDVFVNLAFTLDASTLEGKTTVVFEDLVHNDVVVAHHTDLNDLSQTIHFPKIRTMATDVDTDDHAGTVTDTARIEDVVKYQNLVLGRTYTLKGMLMDQNTGYPVMGADGRPITTEATFDVTKDGGGANKVTEFDEANQTVSGTYTLVFELDSSLLAGHTVVVFEDLYHNDVKVTTHSDIDDDKQSVHYPEIHTMARDESTGDHVGTLWGSMINSIRQLFGETDADGNGVPDDKQQNIIDTVSLENLVPGYTYVVSGILMDVDASHEAGEPVPLTVDGEQIKQAVMITVSEDGKTIRAEDGSKTTVTRTDEEHQSVDGTVELVYTLDSSKISGKKTVVFEDLYHDHSYDRDTKPTEVVPEDLVHVHRDIDDKDQSVSEVHIHTTALDTVTETHTGVVPDATNDNLTIIRDSVEMTKLVPGMEYRIEGALVDITASDFENDKVLYIKPDGGTTELREEAVRQTLTFTAESENESHELRFGICGDYVQGKAVTVFEDLYHNDVKIAIHPMLDGNGEIHPEDFARQTVYYPTGKTNATDNVTGTHTSYAGETRKVTDRVYFENLLVGDVYEIRGQLRYQCDFIDADGNIHRAGEPLEGAETGVKFKAAEDLTKVLVTNGSEDALIDSLEVTELPNGQKVISGYVSLVFTVDASKLAGATLVAFETFYQDDIPLFVHDDLDDYPQTVRIPYIRTMAQSEDFDEASVYDENGEYRDITIVDTVSYQNLWTQAELDQMHEDGKYIKYQDDTVRNTEDNIIYDINEVGTYILKGVLMDKETGEPVTDKDGNTYTVFSEPFTPESGIGTQDVTFVINGKDLVKEGIDTLEGKTLVVFEDLYQTTDQESCGEGTLVAMHHDIEDAAQTIRFPKVRTHAVDGEIAEDTDSVHEDDVYTSVHESLAGQITITDRVSFENLHGRTVYEISGVLQKVTEFNKNGVPVKWEPALDSEGNPITATEILDTTDLSEDYDANVSGTIDLTFTFDGSDMKGETFVVFESLTRSGKLVGIHADITDEGQTIYVPRIGTKLGEVLTGMQEILADKNTVLVDTVEYENLEKGKTYALHARLMNQRDSSEIDGTEVIGTFVAGEDDQVIFVDKTMKLTTEDLQQMAKDGKISVQEVPDDEQAEEVVSKPGNIQIDETDMITIPAVPLPDTEIGTDVSEDSSITKDESETDAEDSDNQEQEVVDPIEHQKEISKRVAELFKHVASDQEDADVSEDADSAKVNETETEEDTVVSEDADVNPDTEISGDETVDSDMDVTIDSDETLDDKDSEQTESARISRVSGTVKVVLPINGKKLAGNTVVAFETLYAPAGDDEAKIVAVHEDIEDKDQSVMIPYIHTSARINGEKSVVASEKMIVTDTVTYKNLTPGQKYTMHGVLMDKATKESTEIVAETDFTPEAADGTMELTFVFDGTKLAGHQLVVFETLTREGPDGEDVIVGEHKDIDDAAQTVTIEEPIPDTPVEVIDTGEHQMMAFAVAAGFLTLLLAAVYISKKRKLHGC